MKKALKITCTAALALLMVSLMTSSVMAAAADYLPTAEDLDGYELVLNDQMDMTDPFGYGGTYSVGTQLWYKNDTMNQLEAVIGVVVIEAGDNPLLEPIPTSVKTVYEALYGDLETWWDLFVAILVTTSPTVFSDVSAEITTTDSAVSITTGESFYAVLAVDSGYVIMTFAFSMTTFWITATINEIQTTLTTFMGSFSGLISAFSGLLSAGEVPVPEASAESYTTGDDVNTFTNTYGTQFNPAEVPGYSLLIVLGLVGGFTLYYSKKRVVRK